MNKQEISDVNSFWNWFSQVANDFGSNFENEELIKELDRRIGQFGGFSWEIGPGVADPKNHSLVITPCGDKDLLPVTKEVVSFSPQIRGWEFFFAKPPKNWEKIFLVQDENGQDIEINANSWFYALLKFDDGTYDIIIKAPELEGLNEDLKYIAASILIDGEIGEELRLKWIEGIEVVSEFDKNLSQKNNPIDVFASHFRTLIETA